MAALDAAVRTRRAVAARSRPRTGRSVRRRRRQPGRGGGPHEYAACGAAWTEIEQLTFEKEALGLYWSGHPVDSYAADLKEFGAQDDRRSARPVAESRAAHRMPAVPGAAIRQRGGDETSVGGVVAAVPAAEDAKRRSDGGVLPRGRVTAASRSWRSRTPMRARRRSSRTARWSSCAASSSATTRTARLLASEILPIAAVRERLARELAITLAMPPHTRATLEALGETLSRRIAGTNRSTLHLELKTGRDADARPGAGVVPHPGQGVAGAVLDEVKKILRRPRGRATMMASTCLSCSSSRNRSACSRRRSRRCRCCPRRRAREAEIERLRQRIESMRGELYRTLTPWQRVLVARHPEPPERARVRRTCCSRISSRSTAIAASPTTTPS